MDRANAMWIELLNYENYDLIILLNEITGEGSKEKQPEVKKYDVFFLEPNDVTKELFKHSKDFDWLSKGVESLSLWINEKPVARLNYRTKIWDIEPTEDSEGKFHYEYLDWNLITDIQPIIEEDILK